MNDTFAEMKDDGMLNFPIGRHKWVFSHGFCGHEKMMAHSLTLSQCAKDEEFTCEDGTCIDINKVSNIVKLGFALMMVAVKVATH